MHLYLTSEPSLVVSATFPIIIGLTLLNPRVHFSREGWPFKMTTFDQVIDDLYRTEEPVYCIFSNLGTKRCLVEISREQLESTPPLLSLVTESDYDIQRLDGQFFSRLLCTEHQNMDVIQGIIQNWLWDQDAMRLSMPGNETPMNSSSLNNPDRKSTRLNSSHRIASRMPSSA